MMKKENGTYPSLLLSRKKFNFHNLDSKETRILSMKNSKTKKSCFQHLALRKIFIITRILINQCLAHKIITTAIQCQVTKASREKQMGSEKRVEMVKAEAWNTIWHKTTIVVLIFHLLKTKTNLKEVVKILKCLEMKAKIVLILQKSKFGTNKIVSWDWTMMDMCLIVLRSTTENSMLKLEYNSHH